jgi:hypothetical protein
MLVLLTGNKKGQRWHDVHAKFHENLSIRSEEVIGREEWTCEWLEIGIPSA